MSENTPQSPYEPNQGGPTPPSGGPTPPPAGGPTPPPSGGPTPPPAAGPAQPPAYGGAGQPPAYGGAGGSYGTQPSGAFGVGEALSFGWSRFTGNWLFWVLFWLLLVVVFAISNSGSFGDYQEINEAAMRGDISSQAAAGVSAGSSALGFIGGLILSLLVAFGINAALREVSGEKATWGSLFRVNNLGMVILTVLLLLVANFVGALLCGLGLIALAIFAPFTYHGVVDKGQNAWEAFTSSFRLVGRNFGAVFLLELALLGLSIVGLITCGLGLFITGPLSFLALAYAYRRIAGGPVATGPATSGPTAYGAPTA